MLLFSLYFAHCSLFSLVLSLHTIQRYVCVIDHFEEPILVVFTPFLVCIQRMAPPFHCFCPSLYYQSSYLGFYSCFSQLLKWLADGVGRLKILCWETHGILPLLSSLGLSFTTFVFFRFLCSSVWLGHLGLRKL